jgi:hypothetical protein
MKLLSQVLYSIHKGTPRHGPWVVACLEGAWYRLLGAQLSRVCRPRSFDASELVIEIIDPAWAQALEDIRKDLEAKLRTATGDEVHHVRLALSSGNP